ncbi:lipopolysaccharide biosynthesis protein [Pseudoalteromonas sp. Angola-18]|jgi:O-antigen/teichoic acid export membrane protein|uniref:lipopolysaccharide biosynthesis protein n=1 Tax=Pseudoalteromonas sp. Angola-18 TaxID=3025338 RepID=UPI002359D0A3|nr:lipopolysaccharide biosynthesis protein [Pseudoalteromonas sp. Angola-18]MDC9500775.1 lipopolysaccharide biosynthesis protein [Pseudoalteromonas sp. Angola-18]
MSLNKKIIKGSLWSWIGSVGYQLSGLIIFIILSRMLSPVDFGTAALAIVFVELTKVLVAFGLDQIVIRTAANEENEVQNNVFISTLLLGVITSLIFIIGAPYLELAFEAPGLAVSLHILSIIPIMQSLTTVPNGILRRLFKFKALALRLLVSSLIAGGVAIYLAYHGYGFYSLIIQKVITVVLELILVWKSVKWRPSFTFHFVKIFPTLKQGKPIVLTSLIGQGIFRFVELLIGYFLGVAALGIFKIAGKLLDAIVQFTIKPIVDVSFSAFAKLKDTPDKLQDCYLNFISTCALFSFPAFFGALVIGPEMVNLIFGAQWEKSGVVFSILCLSGISASLNYFFSQYCHATGNSNIPFRIRIFEFFTVISLVGIFSQLSIYYVAYSTVAVATVICLIMMAILRQKFLFSLTDVFNRLFPSFVSSLFMAGIIYFGVKNQLHNFSPLVKIIVSGSVGAITYILIYKLLFPKDVSNLMQNIKKIRS